MSLETIKQELENDKKLKSSSLAQQTVKLIETLSEKPMDQITSFLGIEEFDQQAFIAGLNKEDKSLKQLGEYMYFIAKEKQSNSRYGMGPLEAAQLTIGYFLDNLEESYIKHLASEAKAKEADKKAKIKAEKSKEDEAKLIKETEKFIKKFKVDKASEDDLRKFAKISNINISKVIPIEEQNGLIKTPVIDQLRAILKAWGETDDEPKHVAKKPVKKVEVEQPSIFDMMGGK